MLGSSRLVRCSARLARSYAARPEPASADSLLQLGTRRVFDENHDSFREQARRFFKEKVVPHHEKWEVEGQVSREVWREAGQLGLLGVTMPEQHGGAGADILYSAIVWEEQSYTGCTGPGFSLHSEIVMPYIEKYGTEEQKKKFLPKMIAGELIGAIAMTEPGAGSDLQGVATHAVKSGSDYLLNGSKTFITNGAMADLVIVVAKTAPEKKAAHGTSLFIVETGMAGFSRGRKLKKLGLRAQDTSELVFDAVRLPQSSLLGELNKGFYYLMNELPQERLLIADTAVAASEACYEWTRTYIKERKAFGKTISDLQTVRHKMAELKTEITLGRVFVDHCLLLHKEKRLDSQTASMAKYWASELQNKVANQCLQLHGGYGFMWEFPVCRAYADARVQSIYGGTNEIMKELIARSI